MVDLLYLYCYGLSTFKHLTAILREPLQYDTRYNLNLAVHETEFLNQGMTKQALEKNSPQVKYHTFLI